MSAAPGRDARVDKAIHVVATSAVSWEDAARVAINEASLTESGQRVEVHRYLVVASVTLASGELHEVVLDRSKRGPSEFHVVVPCAAPPLGFVMGDPLSTPASRAAVMKECRRLWGEMRLVIPARRARCFTVRSAA